MFQATHHVSGLNYGVQQEECTRQHGMARPQVADGGNGLQIWRLTKNVPNN